MRLDFDSVISLAKSDSDVSPTKNPLVFLKEVAHVGTFHKGDMKIPITEAHLDHWVKTFAEMSEEGIEVPVPVEHTKDPEKRRGTVLALSKRTNSRGLPALYAKIKFRDAEAAKLSHSGCSIFVPMSANSGSGKKFKIPVQHICITDYPVINNLEPFKPIALSFGDQKPDDKPTDKPDAPKSEAPKTGSAPAQDPLLMLAHQLGIQATDPQQIIAMIMQMVKPAAPVAQQMPQRSPMPPPMMPAQQPVQPMMPQRPAQMSGRPMLAASFSLDDLPEEILMALSKKQMKKVVKAVKKGKKDIVQ
jgi:hypothetical protein